MPLFFCIYFTENCSIYYYMLHTIHRLYGTMRDFRIFILMVFFNTNTVWCSVIAMRFLVMVTHGYSLLINSYTVIYMIIVLFGFDEEYYDIVMTLNNEIIGLIDTNTRIGDKND